MPRLSALCPLVSPPQCAKPHPLTEFEDSRRSCRASLQKHKKRRQAPAARQREAAAAAAAVASPDGGEAEGEEEGGAPAPAPAPEQSMPAAEQAQQAQQAGNFSVKWPQLPRQVRAEEGGGGGKRRRRLERDNGEGGEGEESKIEAELPTWPFAPEQRVGGPQAGQWLEPLPPPAGAAPPPGAPPPVPLGQPTNSQHLTSAAMLLELSFTVAALEKRVGVGDVAPTPAARQAAMPLES